MGATRSLQRGETSARTRRRKQRESGPQPTSKPISVRVSGLVGDLAMRYLATIDGLHTTDTLGMLRIRLANELLSQQALLKLSSGKRKFAASDYDKRLEELGISDGEHLICWRKNVTQFAGHLYALTDVRVDENADIRKAVRAEFGGDASVAEFAQLADVAVGSCREDFDVFLEALGPFLTARVDFRNHARKERMYVQKGSHPDHQCINDRVSLHSGAFHPMYVLVYLGRGY